MSDTVAQAESTLDLPTLYAALDSLATVVAMSSRDWAAHGDDAWLYGILVGWSEDPSGGDVDPGDALRAVARRYGWDQSTIDRLQALRAAVAGFTPNAIGDTMRDDAEARADTLAEVDALLHDGLRFDQWTARIPHPGRPGYVFADERRYLARYIAEELGGVKGDGEPDVVEDIRRARAEIESEPGYEPAQYHRRATEEETRA